MQSVKNRFKILLAAFFLVLLFGTLAIMWVEHLPLLDAIYFTVITMSTVGYGDISPSTNIGKFLSLSIIIFGVGTFVSLFSSGIDIMLNEREQRNRLEKLNMVIGAFFSELGNQLLRLISLSDQDVKALQETMQIQNAWTEKDFLTAKQKVFHHEINIDLNKVDLDQLKELLDAKRDFLVRLLENPSVLEHENFTSLLWAVFHLSEELGARIEIKELPSSDLEHLNGDLTRVYKPLLLQWLSYMKHLKEKYPYLLSLSIRTSPFNKNASAIVK